MIIKKSLMKNTSKSNIKRILKYISKEEKTLDTFISNCNTDNLNIVATEISLCQKMNVRAKSDKNLHLIVSFKNNESPDINTLKKIDQIIASDLGYNKHQRITTIHNNTDNLHMHILINKIDPITFKMKDVKNDIFKLQKTCIKCEKKFSLIVDNHTAKKTLSECKISDIEIFSGEKTFCTYIKENILEKINSSKSWSDVHDCCAEFGVKILPKGNGLIFSDIDNKYNVKASTVSRDISKNKLEKKIGKYIASDSLNISLNKYVHEPINNSTKSLFKIYLNEKNIVYENKNKELEELFINNKKEILEKIKLIDLSLFNSKSNIGKKVIYILAGDFINKQKIKQRRFLISDEIKKIKDNYKVQKKNITSKYPSYSYRGWLLDKSKKGCLNSIEELKKLSIINTYRSYSISSINNNTNNISVDEIKEKLKNTYNKDINIINDVTINGTLVYNINKDLIKDNGNNIFFNKSSSDDTIHKSIIIAKTKFGENLVFNGDKEYIEKIKYIINENNIDVKPKFNLINYNDKRSRDLMNNINKNNDIKDIEKSIDNNLIKNTREELEKLFNDNYIIVEEKDKLNIINQNNKSIKRR